MVKLNFYMLFIFKHFSTEINNLPWTIFLGGGSVLFELLYKIKRDEITLSDGVYVSNIN